MAKNSAVNLDITNNADGFDVKGGTTGRKITFTGADMTLTGSGTNVYTFPSATDTLVGRTSTDTLTNKTLTSPIISSAVVRLWDGWMDANETWTYASGTGTNVGTFTISGDLTGVYQAGDKFKFTQTTVKYGFMTKVAHSAGTTTVTVYMGTDYTIANAAISANYYSKDKSPFGFPMSPTKWTVTTTLSTNRSTASTTLATLTDTIVVPIGAWRLVKQITQQLTVTATAREGASTLSSDASTETNPNTTTTVRNPYTAGVNVQNVFAEDLILLAASTTFTHMGKSSNADATMAVNAATYGGTFRAICAYL